MPKTGMEPIRRQALINAAVEAIGAEGSLGVTMGQIARRAGVSPALAHHYFGAKEALFLATMRHLLAQFGAEVTAALRSARTPRARISGVIGASFAPEQFAPATVSAWLAFYVHAQRDPAAHRLLRVYARRMQSNLAHDLALLVGRAEALRIAEGIGAMIDGLYIRRALSRADEDARSAVALVEDYVATQIAQRGEERG